jgi:hypothetical protein
MPAPPQILATNPSPKHTINKNRDVGVQRKKKKKKRGYYGYFSKNSLKHISFPQILPEFGRIEK